MRMGASKTQNCFFSKFSYTQTVVRKKNAMKVKVAIARKMLIAIWHVLSEGNRIPIIRSLIQRATHNIPLMVRSVSFVVALTPSCN